MQMFTESYWKDFIHRARVFEWYKRFSEERNNLKNDEHRGRPSTSRTEENIEKLYQISREDRLLSPNDNWGRGYWQIQYVENFASGSQHENSLCQDPPRYNRGFHTRSRRTPQENLRQLTQLFLWSSFWLKMHHFIEASSIFARFSTLWLFSFS